MKRNKLAAALGSLLLPTIPLLHNSSLDLLYPARRIQPLTMSGSLFMVSNVSVYTWLFYILVAVAAVLFAYREYITRRIRNRQLYEQKVRDNMRLEAEVRLRTREIETSREQLAVTLRSIGEGVISAGTDGAIQLMNKAAEDLTGWSQEEAIGRQLKDVLVLQDNSARNPLVDPMKRLNEYSRKSAYTPLLLQISRSGTHRMVREIGAPITGSDGKVIGIVVIVRDMTQEQKMLIRLQQDKKLDSLGVLAGGLAHDFNNLLGGIFGYIEMARDISDQEEVQAFLDSSMEAFGRARSLTQQLLDFASEESPQVQVVNLGDITRKSASYTLSGTNVSCEISIPSDLWVCSADENQIGMVMDHIITNARQSMPEGGIVSISLGNRSLTYADHPELVPGDYIAISIRDTGSGIPPEIMDKIFDPFFTTKSYGNGLGLATCFSIIEKHHGIIEAVSDPGHGSVFTIFIPRLIENPEQEMDAAGDIHDGSGLFLVMDDDEQMRVIASNMLEKMGYDVLTASDGDEALYLAMQARGSELRLRGALLDLTVPEGKGGGDIIDNLREIFPDVNAIAVSGYSSDVIIADPESYGFTASLKKPYRRRELTNLMNTYLQEEL